MKAPANKQNDISILQAVLEEGAKTFSTAKPADKKLYGKLHGSKDLLAFARYINDDFESPWHIKLIAEKLTAVAEGKCKRLIINMPPRHGKSELCSKIFPIWYLGKKPKSEIIMTSYSASKAEDFTRWQRNTCESPFYRDIFPDFSICQDSRAKDQWLTTAGGGVIGAGVDGPITGRGMDFGAIDDPHKNYEEALSEVYQEKVWDWYCSTFLTRLHPGGSQILIQTRWATNDLTGRLIARDGLTPNGGKWDLLKLPAINAKGEALWPERYSVEDLQDIRESIGEKIFQALYQQEPIDLTERLFLDPKFSESPKNLTTIAYLDPAFGGSDYNAFVTGGVDKAAVPAEDGSRPIYIKAGSIWKGQIDDTYRRVEKLCRNYNVGTLYVESNQAQRVVAAEFRRRGLLVREVNNIANKHLRIVNAVKVNWANLRFSAACENDFMKQLLNYSEMSSHDDAPDALAGLIDQCGTRSGNISKRYDIFNLLR